MNSVSFMTRLMQRIHFYTDIILIINKKLITTTNYVIRKDLLKRKSEYKIRIGELRNIINMLVWEHDNED